MTQIPEAADRIATARARKALALVGTARAHRVSADDLAAFDEAGWNVLAEIANVHPPSEETRTLVVEALRNDENRDDPFAGL